MNNQFSPSNLISSPQLDLKTAKWFSCVLTTSIWYNIWLCPVFTLFFLNKFFHESIVKSSFTLWRIALNENMNQIVVDRQNTCGMMCKSWNYKVLNTRIRLENSQTCRTRRMFLSDRSHNKAYPMQQRPAKSLNMKKLIGGRRPRKIWIFSRNW